jgi:hypothetical protein
VAFIVEMWWGRPSELIVQDIDENGELYEREVIPLEGPPDPERRTFSCHGDNWQAAQELGTAFGWTPRGPLFHRWRTENPPTRVDSYAPDGWMEGLHEVEADDARAWGAALEACVSEMKADRFELPVLRSAILLREGMTVDQYRQANRGLTRQFLRSFAAFLQKGRFKFGWDS